VQPTTKKLLFPPLELPEIGNLTSSKSVPKNNKKQKKIKKIEKEHKNYSASKPPSPHISAISATTHFDLLTIPITLSLKSKNISTVAMIDSGASSNFIDVSFVKNNQIPTIRKHQPLQIVTVDGQPLKSGDITHETIPLSIQTNSNHSEIISFNLSGLGKHTIILGRPWLHSNNPDIDWKSNLLTIPAFNLEISSLSDNSTPVHLPECYKKFSHIFSKEKANILAEHRPYDMTIDLKPGTTPPFLPIYSLSEPELKELRSYIDDNLANGHIQHSKSPAGAPILFVKKKDGSLRMCVDYRKLNEITIKNRYPLPLITEILNRLSKSTIFTKIDLRGAYSLVRMNEDDQWKTAFRTRYGHYEYRVMPFGLTNAPATFQHLMNDIFRDFLDIFIIIYLDDLLVFSKCELEHITHVTSVLQRLQDNKLFAKLEKCQFHTTTTEFLGHIISPLGISMCPQKVKTIQEWPEPKTTKQLQSFLGFSNYYRKFIANFSVITAPLTKLLKNDTTFHWSSEQSNTFQSLLRSFTTAPILAYYDPTLPVTVETDASDYAMGAILSQPPSLQSTELHPIAFWSRKFSPAELNYEIHDKELLAIKDSFQEWRAYLIGATHPIRVLTDHKNLEFFMSSKMLNRRQARWAMFFSDFDFRIEYRPGKLQEQADALSRRSDYVPDSQTKTDSNFRQLLKPANFAPVSLLTIDTLPSSIFPDLLKYLLKDTYYKSIVSKLHSGPLSGYKLQDKLLFRHGLLYIPDSPYRLDIVKTRHDSLSAGHFGIRKTLELVTRDYWWPMLEQFVTDYINSCGDCLRSKSSRHLPYGLLRPLPTASGPWQIVTLDFVVKLPLSFTYDSILVVVDTFSKMAHFIPIKETISAEQTAQTYLANVFRLHGAPQIIISDRGPQFKSKFWTTFWTSLNVNIRLSTAYHPQTDGQTERINQIMEQFLRIFSNYHQNNWVSLLPFAEFTYNNTHHTSIKMTPFFANYAHHPRFDTLQLTQCHFPAIDSHHTELLATQKLLARTLDTAKTDYKLFADRKRLTGPEFQVDDLVMLNSRFITTQRPSKKLDSKRLGPFRITDKINDVAFKLDLPPSMKIHAVFHISLLEKYKKSSIPNRKPSIQPPVLIDDVLEYEVEKILDSRLRSNKLEYLVHWKGYDPSHRSWEPSSNLVNSPAAISDFHSNNPSKPDLTALLSAQSLKKGGTVRLRPPRPNGRPIVAR